MNKKTITIKNHDTYYKLKALQVKLCQVRQEEISLEETIRLLMEGKANV